MRTTLVVLAFLLLSSLTGCARSYVPIPEGETIEVPKGTLDELYRNNELLLQELEACREAHPR